DNIVCRSLDVTADDAVENFYDLIECNGGADTVLYAAGVGWSNPEMNLQEDVDTVGVNVDGFTRIVNAAYRYFRDTANNGRGQIAAITSVAGTMGLGVSAAYSASKRYQQTYLQALAQLAHMQRVAVDITDIRPGFIRTPLLKSDRKYPLLMNLDYAAPRIELAILRRRRVQVVDWRWNVVVGFWRMIPSALWRRLPVRL
ncbi:MAG: SDR family NAD(P)-dependent oxidoreductase, partial [Muribaculaceae bacterium]|nr:SDR family NAD(P)-dependent oxidoreductase [Muribaculaceae bacterium]